MAVTFADDLQWSKRVKALTSLNNRSILLTLSSPLFYKSESEAVQCNTE
jgi:hypothetical protein